MANTLLDAELRRSFYLYGFGSSMFNEYILTAAQKLSRSQVRIINEHGITAELGRREFERMLVEMKSDFSGEWSKMFEGISLELQDLTVNEAQAANALYTDTYEQKFLLPQAAALISYANNGVMILESGNSVRTGTWAEMTKRNATSAWELVKGIIRRGYRDKLTNTELIRAIRGVRNPTSGNYNGGAINGLARSSAETLARTGVNHYASTARDKWAQGNKDILASRILIATLDNRTTSLCAGRHLTEWALDDDSYPRLPFHFGERSIYVFTVDGYDPLEGTRASVQGQHGEEAQEGYDKREKSLNTYRARQAERKASGESYTETSSKVKYRGRKDSHVFKAGQVDANMTFDQFIQRQPDWFVKSQFGATRAKLIKNGKLSVDRLTDANGKQLTIKQLRELSFNEQAFRKAGL